MSAFYCIVEPVNGHLWDQNTYLRKRDVLLKLPLNGEQKRATWQHCCETTLKALLCVLLPAFIIQVVESSVNIDLRLDKTARESLHTRDLHHIIPKRFASVKAPFQGSHSSAETIEPLERGTGKPAICTVFVEKDRTALYFLQQQPATTLFVARQA